MPDRTLIIGNKKYSSWSLRPWVLMRHHQIEFVEKRVSLFVASTQNELAPYNSDFKVPVLQDGAVTVWDSLSILDYISETYLDGRGWPRDPCARAYARSVSAEMHASFSHVRNELPMNCEKVFEGVQLSHGAVREIERIAHLWRECRARFGGGGPWLFGTFSIADAMYAPVAIRFDGYRIAQDEVAAAYVKQVLTHMPITEWIEAGKREQEIIDADEIESSRFTSWRKR